VSDTPAGVAPRAGWARLLPPLAASLTLGLAPFAPEPHLLGKIRWVLGGAVGMQAIDWGDLLLHGAPWLWLAGTLFAVLRRR
jgi:hypothetical protein